MVAKVISIYLASARKNDFAGAHNFYDMWIWDEFKLGEKQGASGKIEKGSTVEGRASVNTMLKVLDGQKCRLDCKYAKIFLKKKKIPIIMISNRLPALMEDNIPLRMRYNRLRMQTKIQKIEEEKVIPTLLGCINRRIMQRNFLKKEAESNKIFTYSPL